MGSRADLELGLKAELRCPTPKFTGLVLIQADIMNQLSAGLNWVRNSVIFLHSNELSAFGLACCFPTNASIVNYLLRITKLPFSSEAENT